MVVKTKMPTALRRELEELNDAVETQRAIYSKLDPDSKEGQMVRGRIAELAETIEQIQHELDKKEAAEEKVRKKNNWRKEVATVDEVINKNYMGYIIPEDKFIYCRDYGKTQNNVQFKLFPATRIVRILNKMTGMTIAGKDYQEVIDYFESKGRSFYDVTSSFNTGKWNESEVYNKMSVIRDHWLQPDYENSHAYDPDIDLLVYAICGGKEENIEHLEKWVAFKYLNPGRNANIPNIDMGGNPGGNGKGRFVELLKTIFTPTCVVQAHKEELEKFNANWEMAVILYYDEPEEKELAASKLKQATGAEDMRVEKKGIDATMADRNYNFIFLSNNEKGVVKLSGGSDGGEDRRYSVITTDLVLLDLVNIATDTQEDARNRLDKIAQQVVKDRTTVARWLAHIIQKHDASNLRNLPALHGEDYHRRFDEQKDAITEAFDKLLPILQHNKCVPQPFLHEVVKTLTENTSWKAKTVVDKFQKYLTRNKIEHELKHQCSVKITWQGEEQERIQPNVVCLTGGSNWAFDYSTVSKTKWRKGLKDANSIDSTNIAM